VTLIMSVVLLASIAGIVLDRILETSPAFVLTGFVAGNLIAFIGLWLYIRAGVRR
jgi:F0F1-type ATP synthase assembly protein I